MPVGLHIDMQNALKSKFKEEFVQINEELAKQKELTKQAEEEKEALAAEHEKKLAQIKE